PPEVVAPVPATPVVVVVGADVVEVDRLPGDGELAGELEAGHDAPRDPTGAERDAFVDDEGPHRWASDEVGVDPLVGEAGCEVHQIGGGVDGDRHPFEG